MKGLLVAIQFLTRLPTPRFAVSNGEFAASIRWFPAVGLIIGGLIAGSAWLGMQVDAWVGALAALVMWTGVTGALHLDGLGDIADASGAAHKDRDKLLAVLSDPHIGSFGVVAIALQLLAKLILLHAVLEHGMLPGLILAPFAARLGPLIWTIWLPPLHEGLAVRFRGSVRMPDLLVWATALAIAIGFVPGLSAIVPVIAIWGLWLRRRIGGISGDGHGAGIELAETLLLLALAIWPSL
jgi:adenosylcobinamide-GDP ribazoletransferase